MVSAVLTCLACVVPAAAEPGASSKPRGQIIAGYPELTDEQAAAVRSTLEAMKSSPRGPYLQIVWFCNDGTRVLPRDGNCQARGGGHQRAELTAAAAELGALGIHVGTLLMATPFAEFVDRERDFYRLRELVVESFLVAADDGWVLRRARYYRGAAQVENEEERGREHLVRLLGDPEWRRTHALLARLITEAVPHGQPGIPGARIRLLAERMAALDERLQDLRIKIHSRPGPEDLDAVLAFREQNPSAGADLHTVLDSLTAELTVLYRSTFESNRWNALTARLAGLPIEPLMRETGRRLAATSDPTAIVDELAAVLREARRLTDDPDPPMAIDGAAALALIDTTNYAGALLHAAASTWISQRTVPRTTDSQPVGRPVGPTSRREFLDMLTDLLDAAYGTGWLSTREHAALRDEVPTRDGQPAAAVYRERIQYVGSATDWGQAALHQTFGAVLDRYREIEPVARRFEDSMIRASALLSLANVLEILQRDADVAVGVTHSVFDLEATGRIRGLNPGLAVGTLTVLEDERQLRDLDPRGIYVIPETYAELGRVSGILTLNEGSRLSHVQLLARSMGIPNAVVSPQLVESLRRHDGEQVFYAVSNLGTVVVKLRSAMTPEDTALVEEGATAAPVIELDEQRLDLSVRRTLTLDEVTLEDSGRIVGPKAANLSRLRRDFPGRVAEGLVIPFGVFRAHLDRDLLGSGRTTYEDLELIYARARAMEAAGEPDVVVTTSTLSRLREVREAIRHMDLPPWFAAELVGALRREFGAEGTYGVFVRSDTNVEDLPTFTGAGLNLTVMNQISEATVLDAVRQVWASPFSERSYTWRQQLLVNPEHVYPSVVLLRSVPVEASGVLVTRDLLRDRPGWWTITLSPGIGGVVEGEPAETVLMPEVGGETVLLSSARAIWQKVLLMTGGGGIARMPASGDAVLLTAARAADLRSVLRTIDERYAPVVDESGDPVPWDVEFGFLGDATQLFQIRPLVTNRRIRTLQALTALDSANLSDGYAPVDLDAPPLGR